MKLSRQEKQYIILLEYGQVACERDDTIFKYFYNCSSIVECEEQRETTGKQI